MNVAFDSDMGVGSGQFPAATYMPFPSMSTLAQTSDALQRITLRYEAQKINKTSKLII
jgi:hypothetical protein